MHDTYRLDPCFNLRERSRKAPDTAGGCLRRACIHSSAVPPQTGHSRDSSSRRIDSLATAPANIPNMYNSHVRLMIVKLQIKM